MIQLADIDLHGYPTIDLRTGTGESPPTCPPCIAFRPDPQLDGNLQVDPEIHLPSPGMDVDIAYYYNAVSVYNGPFGFGRNLSTNLLAQASGSPAIVTLTRGNGIRVSFQDDGTGHFVAQTPGLLSSLVKDTTDSLWKETTLGGHLTAYPLNTTGMVTTLSYAQDAVGNYHTFTYASGLLSTLEDAVGRVVSFSYSGGLLQTVEDWVGRLTTFAYDTASASPKNLLTTVTGPSGCQTGYQYTTFTVATAINSAGYEWLLSGLVDPNGYATSYTYDQQKRVVTRTIAGGAVTTYLYQPGAMWEVDALGNVATQSFDANFALTNLVDAGGGSTTYTRNANAQETSRQNPLGAVWTTTYDASGNPSSNIDPLGFITTYQHDAYNNPTTITYADGSIVTQVYGYAGSSFDTTGAKRRVQAVVDALGNRTSYTFNGRGQVATVQNPLGFVTTYGYDSLGNRTSVQDALGNVTTSVFDAAGNMIATVDALGNRSSVSYDPQSRPLTWTDTWRMRPLFLRIQTARMEQQQLALWAVVWRFLG